MTDEHSNHYNAKNLPIDQHGVGIGDRMDSYIEYHDPVEDSIHSLGDVPARIFCF